MSDYVLSCCSTADLPAEHLEKRQIVWLPFHFTLDGVAYRDDLGQTVPYSVFYEKLKQGAEVSTSQVSVGEYEDHFAALMKEGHDVLHVCFSSGLSGSYRSACIAAENVREQFPSRRLIVLDSMAASSGYGMLMDSLADLRDEGISLDDAAAWVEENKFRINHWFFSTDLSAYIRGGRISKTAGLFGGLLEICPLLDMDGDGRLAPRAKVRTKKRVMAALVDKMELLAENGRSYAGKCYLCHSSCREDAEAVAALIRARFPNVTDVVLCDVGTTVGCHTGSGTVAVFFFGESRRAAAEAEETA